MIYVVSFPRSGNTWFRYIVEAVSGRPTLGVKNNEDNDLPIHQRTDRISASGEPIARKSHWWHHIEDEITEDDGLVLILRNYKEAIIRHVYYRKDAVDDEEKELHVQRYMTPLQKYDGFSGSKELVYYEDLISNPVPVARRVSDVFGFSEKDVREFAGNVGEHVDASLAMYDSEYGSYTEGEKEKHHSGKLTREELRDWDARFRDYDPEVYDKYLSHYETEC